MVLTSKNNVAYQFHTVPGTSKNRTAGEIELYLLASTLNTHLSSWVMTTSWKLDCARLVSMIFLSASAKDSLFAASRFVVGSSSARMPHLKQKVSAKARRMIKQARTYKRADSWVLQHS